jgi:hypothetical protein
MVSSRAEHVCYCLENPNVPSNAAVARAAYDGSEECCGFYKFPDNDLYFDAKAGQVCPPMPLLVAKRSLMNLF